MNRSRDDEPKEVEEGLWEEIREKGDMIGIHEWNTGNPGGGAGVTYVHLYNGFFYAEIDNSFYGPYATFEQAAEEFPSETNANEKHQD